MTNPACVSMAPISNSMNVGTERIGRALVRNVIHSNRVPGIVEYPLFPIAASRRIGEIFLLKAALSQPKDMPSVKSVLSAEKARLPPFVFDVNSFFCVSSFFVNVGSVNESTCSWVLVALKLQTPENSDVSTNGSVAKNSESASS